MPIAAASQPKVASVNPIPEVTGLSGLVQGVNVVNNWILDQADTELLPEEHAERTCHS